MKIALIVNTSKEKAISCAYNIATLLQKQGAELIALKEHQIFDADLESAQNYSSLFEKCDLAVTVGGDGTIIHSAKYAAKADKPMIGVNVGRLGFAAEVEPDNIEDLNRLLIGDYSVQKRMLLDVTVRDKDGREKTYLAVNEANIARGQLSRMIDISVSLDNSPISSYHADGLLFSTPTGSTAYALSAGGPVIYPEMKCILLTPVCPHSLISRSVVFGSNAVLTARIKLNDSIPAVLSIDGERNISITPDDFITIKKSDKSLKLITLYDRNFYQLLNEKLKERKS